MESESNEPQRQPAAPLRIHRDATIARLCEHFARDDLDPEELERLIDQAHRSTTAAELAALLRGLPALVERPEALTGPDPVNEARQTVVAIMGGAERKGAWTSSRRLQVLAIMGGAVLDFREARLPPGKTELVVVAIMGGVEIIVPPGLAVASDGMGIMGGFEHSADSSASPESSSASTLHISGLALMGGVEITERRVNETAKAARKRRKQQSLPPRSP